MRKTLETQLLQIIDGPGKFELSISLLDDGNLPDDEGRRGVSFKLDERHIQADRISGFVESISHAGKDFDELTIELELSTMTRERRFAGHYHRRAELEYNCRTRKGLIVLAKRTAPVPV